MLWFLSFKLIACCFIPIESPIIYYLGDASGFMGGPRQEMGPIFALWTLPGAFIAFTFMINRKNKTMNSWLQIFDICGTNAILSEHDFDEEMALKFRKRVNQTIKLFNFILYGSMMAAPPCFLWTYFNRWPQSYRYSIWTFIWSFTDTLWVYYNQNTMQSSLILFHQICYYITLRFQKFDKDIKKALKENNLNKVFILLKNHNEISELTFNCNKFWQTFVATTYVIQLPLALVTVHVSIFSSNLLPAIRVAYCFMTFTIVTYTTIMILSASHVERWVCFQLVLFRIIIHNLISYFKSRVSYNTLNSITQNKMPLFLSIKLSKTIQRIGGNGIGFTILDIYIISYRRYFNVSLYIYFIFYIINSYNKVRDT